MLGSFRLRGNLRSLLAFSVPMGNITVLESFRLTSKYSQKPKKSAKRGRDAVSPAVCISGHLWADYSSNYDRWKGDRRRNDARTAQRVMRIH